MMKAKYSEWLWSVPLSVVLIAGCNSGSDSSSGSGASVSASVAIMDKATAALNYAQSRNSTFANTGTKNLGRSLAGLNTQREAKLARIASAMVTTPTSHDCAMSGSYIDAFDATSGIYTVTYMDCVAPDDSDSNLKTYKNGVQSGSASVKGFTFADGDANGPYIQKTMRMSDDALVAEFVSKFAGSVNFSADLVACGSRMVSLSLAEAISGTASYKEYAHRDGKLKIDEAITMTDLKLSVTGSAPDLKSCEPTKVTFSESGKFSATDNLNAKNSVSVDIAEKSPMKATWTEAIQDGKMGKSTTIDGTISITSDCFTGTITLVTTTPVFTTDEDDCPTLGEVKVTGDVTATITHTSTGGVNIDEGSNGSIDKSFKSCEEAGACI